MRKEFQSHLRRNLAILNWISIEQASAPTRWRSAAFTPWRDLKPRWKLCNNRIHFEFSSKGRTLGYWVSSIQRTRQGVCIRLMNPAKPVPEPLDVCWGSLIPSSSEEPRVLWDLTLRWLQRQFAGCRILRAVQNSDRVHSLSRSVLRVLLQVGKGRHVLLISDPDRPEGDISDCLTQGLLWVSLLQKQGRCGRVVPVALLVSACDAAQISHQAGLLNRERLPIEVWEYRIGGPEGWEVKRFRHPPPPIENLDFRWPPLGPYRWSPLLAKVMDLAPDLIRRHPSFDHHDTLRLRGLEFAHVSGPERDRISYGVGGVRIELTEDRFDDLRLLVEEIVHFRRPRSPDPRHQYYRLQGERWLESMILEGVDRLFPELAAESVYSQIPVYLGKNPGRVDILGIDRQGRLTVLELKIFPDPGLPLQALDYWGRVIGHNRNGDFEARGYFSRVRVSREQPKIYLVSPVFSFHDSFDQILHFLNPSLEVWKISINEDWRCGVRVLRRARIHCGELI